MSQELSQHKACEPPKLYIQVMGKAHPDGHRFVFYDITDQQVQQALADKVEEEDLPTPLSRIHGWPWKDQPERNVWLEIASDGDAPIRVSLFERVGETPWQEHPQRVTWQHHVVQPVMPLAFWQSLQSERARALPIRPGYLYVYYQGAVWREIEITLSQQGQWQFRDIDLARHRDSASEYTDNQRPGIGKSLSEIWLPARQNLGWLSTAVRVAFSEVQWSAPRLNYLNTHPAGISRRFQAVSLQRPSQAITSGRLVAPDRLIAQRGRCPDIEWQLAEPELWTEDLLGQAVATRFAEAKSAQQTLDAGGTEAMDAWERPNPALALEAGLCALALEKIVQQDSEQDDPLPWEEAPSSEDVFSDARRRGIPGLVIDDAMFALRHAQMQTQQAQHYLSLLLERCARHPHYQSALLVQKRIIPERIAGQDNPLHEFADDEVLSYHGGTFHTAIATLSRYNAHSLWETHQTRLADYLSDAAYQRALADYFSLEGGDYLSGFAIAQQLFTALSLDRQRADTLLDRDIASQFGDTQSATAARTLQALLEDGSDEPLHAMCFPDSAAYRVEQPFVLPETEINDGSGVFRSLALAEQGQRDQAPEKDELHTLEASLLAAMARSSTTSQLKGWTGTIDIVFAKFAESGKNLLGQIADENQRTVMAARIYLPSFNASRAALHTLIGDLTFQPLADVDLGNKVLLGVEDVASGLTFGLDKAEREYMANHRRQFYGNVYRTADGTLLGATNRRRLNSMSEIGEAREMRFIFADADSRAAELVRRGRTRIGMAERAAGITKLPYILVVVEAMNLAVCGSAFLKTKKSAKTALYAVSAMTDLGLATLNISEYIAKRHQAPRPIIRVSQISQKVVIRNQGTNWLARRFPQLIRINWLATKASGILLAITMAWEALGRFDEGDTDAGIAYALAAVGAVMLMIGPLGWIGLALLLGGSIAGTLLTDGPFEAWLKHGPFGNQKDDAPWLQDPKIAYYRLQGLFANIRVTRRRMSPIEQRALLAGLGNSHDSTSYPIGERWQQHGSLQDIDTAIEVRSALPGMGVELKDRLVLTREHYRNTTLPRMYPQPDTLSSTRVQPLLTQIAPHRLTYFVHTPRVADPVVSTGLALVTEGYRWQLQLQFHEVTQPPLRTSRRIFPAPKPLVAIPDDMTEILSIDNAMGDYWIKETL
ncbi:hypothetical protein SAMN05661010_03549 [Modicisalibacter muralis]|uniref:Uncharacterized protein n=1 Tax=Modicisalibacter muralis TaxID=119000 RepID=A0A1G9R145_9GAMM|nr:toxin VasX [Halomonas muralis]SDM17006.1 hypothetical protein SAMN05661010_03549 [Halomonas muralis]